MFWNNAVTSCYPRLFRASFSTTKQTKWRPKRRFVKFDQKLIQERLLLVQVGNVFVDIFLKAISRAIQNVIQLRKEKRMRDQHSITNTREWMHGTTQASEGTWKALTFAFRKYEEDNIQSAKSRSSKDGKLFRAPFRLRNNNLALIVPNNRTLRFVNILCMSTCRY